MEFFSRSTEEAPSSDSTLVVATVSVGNVGQLACELILANYSHLLVGYLSDPNVLPCFGHDPFSSDAFSTSASSLELYALQGVPNAIYVLQQRAPAQIGRQRAFAENMAQWIADCQFKNVLILSSMDAEVRQDAQMQDQRCWYVHVSRQSVPEFEQVGLVPLTSQRSPNPESLLAKSLPPWSLLTECQKRGVDATALVTFTVEGDNLPDGMQQAKHIQKFLKLATVESMVLPPSAHAFYGRHTEWV